MSKRECLSKGYEERKREKERRSTFVAVPRATLNARGGRDRAYTHITNLVYFAAHTWTRVNNEVRDPSRRNCQRACVLPPIAERENGRILLIETFKSIRIARARERARARSPFSQTNLFMQRSGRRAAEWETDHCHYVARRLKIYLAFPSPPPPPPSPSREKIANSSGKSV